MAQKYVSDETAINEIARELFYIEHGIQVDTEHPQWPRALLEASKMYAAFNLMRFYEQKS